MSFIDPAAAAAFHQGLPYGATFVQGAPAAQTFVGAPAAHTFVPGAVAHPSLVPATSAGYFYPSSPKPPVFELPKPTNYKNWRQTEVELGRFNQTMSAYARQNGLM